jgi:hypothetical protein
VAGERGCVHRRSLLGGAPPLGRRRSGDAFELLEDDQPVQLVEHHGDGIEA